MKIKELKNAPDWLKNANVINEDVDITNDVVIWKDGTWEYGFKSIGFCKWKVFYSNNTIRIGCVQKSIKGWDIFFESDEEIETKRDTKDFELIKKSYLLAKYAIELKL